MKTPAVIPFLLLPFFMQNTEVRAQLPEKPITASKQNPIQDKHPLLATPVQGKKDQPEELDPTEMLKNMQQRIPKLTTAEKNAAEGVKAFIEKYTDGKLHYGSLNNLVYGLTFDYDTINQKSSELRGLKRIAVRRYPNNLFPRFSEKIRNEVENRGYTEIPRIFEAIGVNPNTAKTPDQFPPRYLVTEPVLQELVSNLKILQGRREKVFAVVAPGIPITLNFPGGLTAEAMDHTVSGVLGLPPGSEIAIEDRSEKNLPK